MATKTARTGDDSVILYAVQSMKYTFSSLQSTANAKEAITKRTSEILNCMSGQEEER